MASNPRQTKGGVMNAQETIVKLKNFGNGAHAHAANKCAMYIDVSIEQNKPKVTEKLVNLASQSMSSGDWKDLKNYMINWW